MPVRRVKVKSDQADAELVQAAVEAIRAGQLVALPTETVYGFAADPSNPRSIERVRTAKQRTNDQPLTHHITSRDAVASLAPELPLRAARLADRYWPGPLTLVVPGASAASVGMRVPAHAFTREVLGAFDQGLFLTSTNVTREKPLCTPDEIAAAFPDIDLLCDSGPATLGQASAVVRLTGPELEVLREGTLSADEILRASATTVLFVCTGNTCRSPLAKVIARQKVATALRVETGQLMARGLWITSAGTAAGGGSPASAHALQAAAEIDLDLAAHRSRGLGDDLVAHLGRAYALTQSHLQGILLSYPQLADRVTLLDPQGRDIPDPFGGPIETYRMARTFIGNAVTARMPEILGLL